MKNEPSPSGNEGGKSHEKQANSYHEGNPEAKVSEEKIDGFRDQSGKTPYGRKGMGWADKSGKLGDLDPQETDQQSWVGTWSPLVKGSNGVGIVVDENYDVQRPRTQSRQEERFKQCNPEFQDVADDGDWTSSKWTPNV